MNKTIFVITLLLFDCICCTAANFYGSVTFSDNGKPADGAAVRLLDTANVQKYYTVTDKNGKFEFKNPAGGTYILHISYVGYKSIDFEYSINDKSKNNLGTFALTVSETKTGEVVVEADAILGKMVGDTTQYNAGAFRVDSSAKVNELLQKIPGIKIDGQGKITAQGKTVKKLLVDGKKFFSDDPKTVLDNIPAKIVDKVQVYDKATDENEFIGNDLDKDDKAINLVLKDEAKNGMFGSIDGGAGTRGLYTAGIFSDVMLGAQRSGIMAQINNIDEDEGDFSSVFSASPVMSAVGSGNIVTDGGICKTSLLGISTSNDFSRIKNAALVYFLKKHKSETRTTSDKEYLPKSETSEISKDNDFGSNENYYHSLQLSADEIKLSERNKLRVNLNAGCGKPKSGSTSISATNYQNGNAVSRAVSDEKSRNTDKSASVDLVYSYNFDKPGRTLGISFNSAYSDDAGTGTQISFINYDLSARSDTIRLRSSNEYRSGSNSFNINAGDSFGKYSRFNFNYSLNLIFSDNDRFIYNTESGNLPDSLLSEKYKGNICANNAEITYHFEKKKFTFETGLQYQNSNTGGRSTFPRAYKINYSVNNLTPSARVQYNFKDPESGMNCISLDYSSATIAPQPEALRNVVDNSNPLWLTVGNPNLKASTSHFCQTGLLLTSNDFKKSFYLSASYSLTRNTTDYSIFTAKTDTVVYGIPLAAGSHLSRPINLNDAPDFSVNFSYSMPLPFVRDWNCNFEGYRGYSASPSMINGSINRAKNTTYSFSFNISSPYSEKIQANLGNRFTYNNDKNSSMSDDWSNKYSSYELNAYIKWKFYKAAYFSVSYSNSFYSGSFYDKGNYNANLLSGGIGAEFFKNKILKAELIFTDLLHERKSIQNFTSADYMAFSRSKILQNYIMLRLTYNFNTLGRGTGIFDFLPQ